MNSEPRASASADSRMPTRSKHSREGRLPTVSAASAVTRRRGFSLLEMMIAIVILGLGLIMVATIFPVAWTRARALAEFTTQAAITASADTTLRMIARVENVDSLGNTMGTFAGEPIIAGGFIQIMDDHRVHLLHMENMLVGSIPQAITPERGNPSLTMSPAPPWMLERVCDAACQANLPTEFFQQAYGAPQVRFESRMYPPLPWRNPDVTVTDTKGAFLKPDPGWEGELDQRRFAWSIFHRRTEPRSFEFSPPPPPPSLGELESKMAQPRTFDIYFVTLRRSQATFRFAQQDVDPSTTPDPAERQNAGTPVTAVAPQALPADQDVLIPVPWRVQVFFPDQTVLAFRDSENDPNKGTPSAKPPTGVPTEIEVNTTNATSAEFVIDMFAVGTPFVDEESGQIYRVVRRRITGPKLDQAILTLDREVFIEDIDDGYFAPPNDNFGNGTIEQEEQLRTVWVFPPRVTNRAEGEGLSFVGKQPVVGIDVRTLKLRPRP